MRTASSIAGHTPALPVYSVALGAGFRAGEATTQA
jgi:hypothetical protein